MDKQTYVEFLNSFKLPSTFSYCMMESFSKDDNYKPTGEYIVSEYEVGHNASLPIKVEIIKMGDISTLYHLTYFNVNVEFRVYSPTNISPDQFFIRLKNKIRSVIRSNENEDVKNKLEKFYEDSNKNWHNMIAKAFNKSSVVEFLNWTDLRNKSNDNNYKLCYCGHTFKCECSDPTLTMFNEHLKNENIILSDPNNGWSNQKED